jgi:carboxypeptidase PM20D1
MIKRVLIGLVLLLAALAVAVVGNTWRQGSRQVEVAPLAKIEVDADGAAASLAEAVRARTVSGLLDPAGTAQAFDALHAHLVQRYPRVHAALERELVGAHSLLYTWRGSDPAAPPIGLMAHQDVAPVAPGTDPCGSGRPSAARSMAASSGAAAPGTTRAT